MLGGGKGRPTLRTCFLTGFFLGFFFAPISTDDAATRIRMVWCRHVRSGRQAGRRAGGSPRKSVVRAGVESLEGRRDRVVGGRARRTGVAHSHRTRDA